jgi:hypothetical protein
MRAVKARRAHQPGDALLADPDPVAAHFTDGAGAAVLPRGSGGFDVVGSRAIGGAWLLDGLWRAPGVDRALRKSLGRGF